LTEEILVMASEQLEVPAQRLAPPVRRPRRAATPLMVVSACVAAVQMSWSLVVPVLPDYAKRFGLGPAQLGVVVGIFGVGRLLVNIPAGLLSQRVDRRWLMLLSTLAVVVGQALTGLATGWHSLLAARLLTGLAGGVAITSGMALLADLTTDASRGRDMATLQGFQLAGSALGPVVGGFLAAAFGSRSPFLISGIPAIAVVLWGRHVLSRVHLTRHTRSPQHSGPAAWFNRDVLGVCLLGFSVFFHRFGGLQALVPLIAYGAAVDLGVSQLGLLLGAITLCNILMVRWVGGLSDRVGRKRVIVPAMAVVAAGSAALALSGSVWVFVTATLVTGVAAGFSGPTPAAYLVDVTPSYARGTVTGVYRTFGDLGGIAGPLLLGVLAQNFGFSWAAIALALVVALPTVAFWALCRESTGPRRMIG
jgi:DHA1 family multidrug resistance protein-like MFS transporter